MLTEYDKSHLDKVIDTMFNFRAYRCSYDKLVNTLKKLDTNDKSYLTVHHKGVDFAFLLDLSQIKHTKKTVIMGNGGLPKSRLSDEGYMELARIPYFCRNSWELPMYNMIWYADASKQYYAKIDMLAPLGWNIGTSNHWFLGTVREILKTILTFYAIPVDDILLYGSSGGATQSMMFRSMLKAPVVLADCPQFDCRKWFSFPKLSAIDPDVASLCEREPYRSNVVECFKKFGYIPRLVINEPFSDRDSVQFSAFLSEVKNGICSSDKCFNVPSDHITVNFIMKNEHTFLSRNEFTEYVKEILN